MTNRIPLIVNAGAAQIQEVSSSDVLTVPGTVTANVVQTDNYQYANGQPFTGGSGNTTPGGANTQVQYNNAGAFGATAGFTFDNVTNELTVPGNVSAGNVLTSAQVIANGEIQSGTGFFTGGYLSVNGNTDLHDTTVTGNLIINNGGPEWSFNTDGSLTLPAGNLAGLGNVVGPGNISYPFGPGPVLLANTAGNNSAYFSLTAVANATGVLGYMGMAQFGSNSSTGLVETNDDTGVTHDWYFNPDGTTAFPAYTFPNVDGANTQVLTTNGSGTLSWSNVASGSSAAGNAGDIQINVAGNIGADPTLRYVDNGGEMTLYADYLNAPGIFTSDIYAGDGTPSNITLTTSYGNATWTFDTTGNLTVPANGVIRPLTNDLTLDALTGNVYVKSKGHTFLFDANGVGRFVMPNNGKIAADSNVSINVGDWANSSGSLWTFDSTGNVTLPSGAILNNANGEVGITTQNPNISVNAILNASYGLSAGTYINQPTTALTGTGVGMTVDYTVLVGNDGIDSVSINTPGLGYANGDQITIPVGIPVSGAIFDITVGAPSTETWTFGQTGELTTPQGGRLGSAGKGWQGLDGGYGNPVSFTSFYANGFYAGCLTASPDGNLTISTYTGNGQQGSWVFDNTGNLTTSGNISAVGNVTAGNVYANNIVAEAPFIVIATNFEADIGGRYGVDTTSNTVTATLPATPPTGGAVFFADAGGAYSSNNLIIDPNGGTIMGASGNMTVSTDNQSVGLFYNGTTWRIYNAG